MKLFTGTNGVSSYEDYEYDDSRFYDANFDGTSIPVVTGIVALYTSL